MGQGRGSYIRTQISLTPQIKKAIEAKRRIWGESLSEYLRKAAILRLGVEEKEKEDLKRLANSVIGSVKIKDHPEWRMKKGVYKWVRGLRKAWER